ncbi:MAG: succinate dehydrogenase assembly factor 2 [Devosia sp.]|nr:succinate dehydrogenase assembly factor 2 [Devosia sp.]
MAATGVLADHVTRGRYPRKHAIHIPRDLPIMALQKDAGEDFAMRLRRLRYRAWHRGTKEMDLLLGPYADARLEVMDGGELDRFETLLEELDTDLLAWLMGQEPAPADADHDLLADLLRFRTAK